MNTFLRTPQTARDILNSDYFERRELMQNALKNTNPRHNTVMPLIGDGAPEFTAQSTNGTIHFPTDYAGKWVVLFSHPSDFTPVCTSEFMTFQKMMDEFRELNTELVGLSVGTLTSHLAWIGAIRDIEWKDLKNTEITFPVIDDLGMRVSRQYGMIHPNASGSSAVRAVFIIDPIGIIRAIIYYPAGVGRNFQEIKRLIIALQVNDEFGVSTPADWQPGEDILVSSPATSKDMRDIKNRGADYDVKSWFLVFKKLGADKIFDRLHSQKSSTKSKTQNKKAMG